MNGPCKVLVIDDERPVADTLSAIFSNRYEVRTAYTAEQALEIIAEWLPDLAVIDVILPGMHGIDLAILLTTKCPACRLLLFSGQSLTNDLLAGARQKGYDFDILAKPTPPREMLETASSLLAANAHQC